MRLYDYELSGNCYKVRLLMSLLELQYERVAVDFFPGREHKSDQFVTEINPLGQLPVLEDGDWRLRDAQAILVYLASRYDTLRRWYPEDPRLRGEVQVWLATADELTRTASAARLHESLGYQVDLEACRSGAHNVLRVVDDHLADRQASGHQWLVGDDATIADIACFPYIALASEGGISLNGYPAVRQWLWQLRKLPRFIGMAGIMALELGQH